MFTPIYLTCLATLTLSACTYNCSCEDQPAKQTIAQPPHTTLKGDQLIHECKFIDESITDSESYSKKMAKSRYAIYYQAMARERISSLQTRAKEIGCK